MANKSCPPVTFFFEELRNLKTCEYILHISQFAVSTCKIDKSQNRNK